MHWCPACEQQHYVHVSTPNAAGATWKYNEDPEQPTFAPDIQVLTYYDVPGKMVPQYGVYCRYAIKEGRIHFHADSKHALSGKTVDLPVFPTL